MIASDILIRLPGWSTTQVSDVEEEPEYKEALIQSTNTIFSIETPTFF